MAVPFTEIMEIKNHLLLKHIVVSQEWIEACIGFVKQEKGHTIPIQDLKKGVFQQWLVADLEEIAFPSLPPDLLTVKSTTLGNNFALQVQGIRDISKPAYSQLKQMEGSVNSNAEFSAAPKEAVPAWEAKPNRMLFLNLTDGCTFVQGMEYRNIGFLSPNLSPGIKVLIKGPVECRLGVFFLKPENIQILGGQVDSKLQQFSRVNILKAHLQIERENSSQEESSTNSESVSGYQETPDSNRTSNRTSYPSTRVQSSPNTGTSNQPSLSSENDQVFERSAENVLDDFESANDDFEQNIDYGLLDEIENSQRQVNQSANNQGRDDDFEDVWNEDEDMVRELMEFQDQNDFKMPYEPQRASRSSSSHQNEVFSYLSAATNNPASNSLITVKGFIIDVLSKLECTPKEGWSLLVKINDGTATVNANMHDKVLEDIIGISAQDMMKKQKEAATNVEVRNEVKQILSKFKSTLQNYNCLMDVKFTPGEPPCIVKGYPVTNIHIQQLLQRVQCAL